MPSLKELAFSKIDEIVETNCPNISRSDSVSKIISLLYSSDNYETIVSNAEFAGIVTVRDLLKVINPERTSVSKVLFKPPAIQVGTPFYDVALALVNNRVRVIPIMDKTTVIGVARQTTILKKMIDSPDLSEFFVEDLMIRNPVTVDLNSSAGVVRNVMLSSGISHAPVVDKDGSLRGIVTAKDLVWTFFKPRERVTIGERKGEKAGLLKIGIKGIVDRHPLHATSKTSVSEVIREMTSLGKGYCLIVEKHKPIGIITPRDVIKLLAEFKPRIQIPLYIFGFDNEDEGQLEMAKRKVERAAGRGLRMHPDLLEVVVHGKASGKEGNKRRYTVKARAVTAKETLAFGATGWSLLDVFDRISDRLDKRLKQIKTTRKNKTANRHKAISERILP